jgi:hypothetical protein
MSNDTRCSWDSRYGATKWYYKSDGKKYRSKQDFCSLKCKTQYDDRYGIDWEEDKWGWGEWFVFVIVAFFVLLYIFSKIIKIINNI